MKLNKISIEFSQEEIEALHYILEIGIRSFDKRPLKKVKNWRDLAEDIRTKLPIKIRGW